MNDWTRTPSLTAWYRSADGLLLLTPLPTLDPLDPDDGWLLVDLTCPSEDGTLWCRRFDTAALARAYAADARE